MAGRGGGRVVVVLRMTSSLSRRPTASWLFMGAVCGLTCLLGSQACGKESRAEPVGDLPASAVSSSTSSPGSGTSSPGRAASAPSHVQEQHFELSMAARGPFKTGSSAEAEIVLLALGAYKVNQEYPIKYRLEDNAGMDYPIPVVKRDRVKFEHARATMTVPFVPRAAGMQRVVGELAFSVCTDQKCVMEKRTLGTAVRVD
jgi:hypothetical protein